jgi:hypothetical protein
MRFCRGDIEVTGKEGRVGKITVWEEKSSWNVASLNPSTFSSFRSSPEKFCMRSLSLANLDKPLGYE